MNKSLHEQIQTIELIIFDIDGVFTDGQLLFSDSGEHIKAFHAHDGLGIKLLQQIPIQLAVISGRASSIVEKRLTDLGIKHLFLGYPNKVPIYKKLVSELDVKPSAIAYVGDDLPDLPVMQEVGLSITVANANPVIAAHAMWQTKASGGHGAVREICDHFLQARNCLTQCLESLANEQND